MSAWETEPEPSLSAIREAVHRKIQESSLRAVAREVGMTPTGLDKMLGGAAPYAPTRRKLVAWYVAHAAATGGISRETATAALRLLLDSVPRDARPRARRAVLAALAGVLRDERAPAPDWLDPLREGE